MNTHIMAQVFVRVMSSTWSSTLRGCPFFDSLFLALFLFVCLSYPLLFSAMIWVAPVSTSSSQNHSVSPTDGPRVSSAIVEVSIQCLCAPNCSRKPTGLRTSIERRAHERREMREQEKGESGDEVRKVKVLSSQPLMMLKR